MHQVTMQYNSLKRKRNKENIYFVLSHKSHNRLFEKGKHRETYTVCRIAMEQLRFNERTIRYFSSFFAQINYTWFNISIPSLYIEY